VVDFYYQCSKCGKRYQRDEVRYLCPDCANAHPPGAPLYGVLSAVFDYDRIRDKFDANDPDWSLFSAVEEEYNPPYPVGNTPFAKVENLGSELDFVNLWVKNDSLNPSGSLKDRASFLMVAEANRLNERVLVTASTGNAACSLSATAAAASKQAIIFIPASSPKEKLVQIMIHGAKVVPIEGTYDDAFRLSLEFTESWGGLNRNTAYHPLTIEGKKTVGLEIWEQNDFKVPDVILVPVGDGVIISGVFKAFEDLKRAGLIEQMPRLVCVQAESSDAIHHYITSGAYRSAEKPETIADSLSVSAPSNVFMAGRAVQETGGFSVTVSDEEILIGQSLLAKETGIFTEPSAAAGVAALPKIRDLQLVDKTEQIVLLITGHGLKDIQTPMKILKIPDAIEPDIEVLAAIMADNK
jgi:threonine synthase